MSILAAFVWVVAITIAGVVWVAIPPLQEATALHLPVAVLFQEAARWCLGRIHVSAETYVVQLMPAADSMAWNDLSVALAAGSGFGIVHAVTMHGGAIVASAGPSSGGPPACSVPLGLQSGAQAFMVAVAHLALMVVAFDIARSVSGRTVGAMADRPGRPATASAVGVEVDVPRSAVLSAAARWAGVVVLHLLWALPSLAAASSAFGCEGALIGQALATMLAVVWAWRVAADPFYEPRQRAARADAIAEAERARRLREAEAAAAADREAAASAAGARRRGGAGQPEEEEAAAGEPGAAA
ncbi:hypothetical protein FNF27_05151 [Cafeteria roenbergensis]|uniref:Uncharacterized protein n=1 Tax=Cafeteria roenbergensis TaxID=33653 RepID=A0A5A8E881_CAFRO|nr:hypothetical protein FNF27_05151 [Cafeteria roenbergensis]